MDVEKVYVETDEDGFYLVVHTSRTKFRFSLDATMAEDLYESAYAEIAPWLRERNAARAEGWDRLDAKNLWPGPITDPKHPDHHDVMVEISDTREVG